MPGHPARIVHWSTVPGSTAFYEKAYKSLVPIPHDANSTYVLNLLGLKSLEEHCEIEVEPQLNGQTETDDQDVPEEEDDFADATQPDEGAQNVSAISLNPTFVDAEQGNDTSVDWENILLDLPLAEVSKEEHPLLIPWNEIETMVKYQYERIKSAGPTTPEFQEAMRWAYWRAALRDANTLEKLEPDDDGIASGFVASDNDTDTQNSTYEDIYEDIDSHDQHERRLLSYRDADIDSHDQHERQLKSYKKSGAQFFKDDKPALRKQKKESFENKIGEVQFSLDVVRKLEKLKSMAVSLSIGRAGAGNGGLISKFGSFNLDVALNFNDNLGIISGSGSAGGSKTVHPWPETTVRGYGGLNIAPPEASGHLGMGVDICATDDVCLSLDGKLSGELQGGNRLIEARYGICLDAEERNKNGGKVHMWTCNSNNKNHQWDYTDSIGRIKARHGLCLDAPQRKTKGSKVQMWSCFTSSKNQQWKYDPSSGLMKVRHGPRHGDLCLDASSRNTNGGKVILWECDADNKNQQWSLGGDGFVLSKLRAEMEAKVNLGFAEASAGFAMNAMAISPRRYNYKRWLLHLQAWLKAKICYGRSWWRWCPLDTRKDVDIFTHTFRF
jgi:hypothetical protein